MAEINVVAAVRLSRMIGMSWKEKVRGLVPRGGKRSRGSGYQGVDGYGGGVYMGICIL